MFSFKKEQIAKYLVLWIQYNKAAIKNSKNLCRVLVETTKLYEDVNNESERIVSELSERCGVKQPPLKMPDRFGISLLNDTKKTFDVNSGEVLELYNGCEIHDYKMQESDDKMIYIQAMKVFCDLKSGKALDNDYMWPDINKDVLTSVFEGFRPSEEHIRKSYVEGCQKFTTLGVNDCHMVSSHQIKDTLARFILFQKDAGHKLHNLISHYTNVVPLDSIIVIDHQGTDNITASILDNYAKKGMHVWRCEKKFSYKAEMWSYVIGKYAAHSTFLFPIDDDEFLSILIGGELHWNQDTFRKELQSLPPTKKPYKTLRSVPLPLDCGGNDNIDDRTESYDKADICRLKYTESDVDHYCYNKCFYKGETFTEVDKGNHASSQCRPKYRHSMTREGTFPIPLNSTMYHFTNFTVLHLQSLHFSDFVAQIIRGATAANFINQQGRCPNQGNSNHYCLGFQAFKDVSFDSRRMRQIYEAKRCRHNVDDPQSQILSLKNVFDKMC